MTEKDNSDSDINEKALKQKLLNFIDRVKVKVRFNDTDAMGIVHFKNYMVYFDDGFVSFMDNISTTKRIGELVHSGIVFPVKHIDITYHNSAIFNDTIIVETTIKKLGNSSITFDHKIFRESDNTLLANVESVRLVMELETKNLLDAFKFFAKIV